MKKNLISYHKENHFGEKHFFKYIGFWYIPWLTEKNHKKSFK